MNCSFRSASIPLNELYVLGPDQQGYGAVKCTLHECLLLSVQHNVLSLKQENMKHEEHDDGHTLVTSQFVTPQRY